jgi:hypothetical protein
MPRFGCTKHGVIFWPAFFVLKCQADYGRVYCEVTCSAKLWLRRVRLSIEAHRSEMTSTLGAIFSSVLLLISTVLPMTAANVFVGAFDGSHGHGQAVPHRGPGSPEMRGGASVRWSASGFGRVLASVDNILIVYKADNHPLAGPSARRWCRTVDFGRSRSLHRDFNR